MSASNFRNACYGRTGWSIRGANYYCGHDFFGAFATFLSAWPRYYQFTVGLTFWGEYVILNRITHAHTHTHTQALPQFLITLWLTQLIDQLWGDDYACLDQRRTVRIENRKKKIGMDKKWRNAFCWWKKSVPEPNHPSARYSSSIPAYMMSILLFSSHRPSALTDELSWMHDQLAGNGKATIFNLARWTIQLAKTCQFWNRLTILSACLTGTWPKK